MKDFQNLPFGRHFETKAVKIHDVLTEPDVRDLLGMKEEEFEAFRKETGLPFIRISEEKRLYFGQDVVELLSKRRVVPGRAV